MISCENSQTSSNHILGQWTIHRVEYELTQEPLHPEILNDSAYIDLKPNGVITSYNWFQGSRKGKWTLRNDSLIIDLFDKELPLTVSKVNGSIMNLSVVMEGEPDRINIYLKKSPSDD